MPVRVALRPQGTLARTPVHRPAVPIGAQEPAAGLSPGAPVPRIADEHAPPALAKVRTWQGRRIAWRLDGAAITNQKDAAAAAGAEVEYEPKLRRGWRPPESTK